MRTLLLIFLFSSPAFSALCDPLTDAQYRNEVVKIVAKNLPAEDDIMRDSFVCVMVKKAIRYRNAGGGDGSTEDIASRCFLKDLYKDVTGASLTADASNHIKGELIENCFPGQGFAP